jgi:hypothetical protein
MAQPVPERLSGLILGILSAIRDRGGFANKTKLLKLLYLADIEYFRDAGSLLTGFKWVYHLYGPWAGEYDKVLNQLAAENVIALKPGTRVDFDTVFIEPQVEAVLDKVELPLPTYLAIKNSVAVWATEPTSLLLDYVYFHTEPMQTAQKGKPIDFSTVVPRDQIQPYKRANSLAPGGVLKGLRRKLLEAQAKNKPTPHSFTPPKYDEAFWAGIQALSDEDA